MGLNYFEAIIPFIGLTTNVFCQIFIFRLFSSIRLMISIFAGFAMGLFITIILESYIFFNGGKTAQDFLEIFIVNLAIYASLGYCYFHFLNLGETARRIRILCEIYDSGDGLSLAEILDRYNAKDIVQRRIERLIDNKQVIEKNGRYYTGRPVMLAIANLIGAMKIMFLGKESEFN